MSMNIQIKNHREALDSNHILLLTSNGVERAEVNKILRHGHEADIRRDTRGCKIGFLGPRLALHITGESGISKPLSIGRIAGSFLADQEFPKPALILLVGFCWGNPNMVVDIGSVILSPRVLSLNEVRETSEGSERVSRHCQSSIEISPAMIQSLEMALARDGIAVRTGPLASLETLYRSTESRDFLVEQFPDLLGGEMEAFGLLPTSIPWLVVKAVSDFGDSASHREDQQESARRAAETVTPLITLLGASGALAERKAGVPATLLEDILTGNALKLHVRELASNGLNDTLNNMIGSPLLHKLSRYVSVLEYDSEFPRLMCAAILELVQNSIKHGRANQATVTLHQSKIHIDDDGVSFDPRKLVGSKGGARDWRALNQRYLESGEVIFSAKKPSKGPGNQYVFSLPKATSVLRNARENCSMHIVPGTVGADYGSEPALKFDENCKILYYYADELRMTSRRISVASAIRDAVVGGRKVYVGCPAEPERVFFMEELSDIVGENLVIFIDAVR